MQSNTPVSTAPESKPTRPTHRLPLVAVSCAVLVCLALAAASALAAGTSGFHVTRAFLARTAQTPVALITLFATPTATASGTPTATASPTPSVVPTALALDADFVFDCDLFQGENEVRKYGCEDGEYVMLNKEATTRYSYYDVSYNDVDVEARGHWVSGEGDYEYGIVWRAATDGDSYYVFIVTDDGKYNVAIFKDDKYTDLIPYTASSLVNTGDTPNRLRVVARGDKFDFYLNDTQVGSVTDSNLTGGNVGVFFYNAEPNTTVAFDEFKAYTFDAPTPGAGTATTTPTPTLAPRVLDWDANLVTDCDLFEGENEVRKYGCEDGKYVMLNKQATTRYSYYDKTYENAEIEAEGHWVSGEGDYEYGIVWRANEDGDAYYVFTVTEDGRYNVALYKDDKYTDLIPYTASPLVNTGDTPNRFRLVAQGDRFDFYLNDSLVGSAVDDNLTGGYVGAFFYNKEPNTTVAFDELKVYTFAAPTPTTGTPEASFTPLATFTPTATTALATATPTSTSVSVAPGVYVTDLRLSPSAPKQGQPVTFLVSFLNSTAKPQTFKWFVEIWEADTSKRNPYGQADARQREIPVGANERTTFDSWKRAGGGPCQSFRARVVFEDDQARRIPFKRPDGADLWKSFQICP